MPSIAAVLLQLPGVVQAAPLPARTPVVSSFPWPADRYRLGPGDALELRFLDPGAAQLAGPVTILADGTATAALLGSVDLAGLTLNQAQQLLRQLYSRHLRRPELTLAVVTPRPLRVTVLGEVERPGVYELPPLGASVVAALQAAGGATLQANLQDVALQRQDSGNRELPLNLAALLQQGDQRQNPLLFDGDTLRVGRLAETAVADPQVLALASTNLRPATIRVNVIGEVRAPGRLELPAGTAMVEAVLAAGGAVPWRGRVTQAELVRVARDGTTRREFITLRDQQNVSAAFNPPLQNNDTVIVHRTLYAKSLDLLNQVLVPLATVGNYWWLYRSFTP
ncbi:MAG: SLBB domain-containing protein [Cyanobacteriota bacterium]|nr:SLBB domain-containing protein [Cyanobacteriota bacterium]